MNGHNGRMMADAERRARLGLVGMAGKDVPGFEKMARWIVAVCRPGTETRIHDDLATLGIECWCPMEKKRRPPRRGLKAQVIHTPLFRGYLFVRVIPMNEAFVGVLSASRLSGLMGHDGVPTLMPERIMERLRLSVAKRLKDQGDDDGSWWRDCHVTVTHGPFASFKAVVRALVGKGDKVKVDVEIFGRATPVELDIDSIRIGK